MEIRLAKRLETLPEYLFDMLDRKKAEAQAKGVDVIDLGVGDPDKGSPDYVVEALIEAAKNPANHHYPSFKGLPAFRKAVADWYQRIYGVPLDPNKEVLLFVGSKIGINTVPLALCEPGDVVLCPDPCYTAYHPGVTLIGGKIHSMPLFRENGFMPDLDAVPEDVRWAAKVMLLNYPGNPTAALATRKFFEKAVDFARKYEIVVVHDAPYSQTVFDGNRAMSILEIPGAKEVAIEFNSLSKVFNMTGWRIAYAVGNATVIQGLGKVKSNIDMGVFEPIQHAAIAALKGSMDFTKRMNEIYQRRRDVLVEGLNSLGWNVIAPPATFFMWTPIPNPGITSSMEFAAAVLDKAGIIISPGIAFGKNGEGYIRIALTRDESRMKEAVKRLRDAGFVYSQS